MKWFVLLLILLVTLYLFCLLVKLWFLSKRKKRLHHTILNGLSSSAMRLTRKKRRQRF
ncbi:hypothetical protein ACFOGG_02520 [Brenneria rubrifaciens]|uniref:hypothetical protein n=1 Tax=Brenneria rubrifaciens TaxID=55213 RepID=UPI00360BCB2A